MALSNLKAELARKGINQEQISHRLDMTLGNLNKKINGRVPFTTTEAFVIKDEWFPELTVDYLFREDVS